MQATVQNTKEGDLLIVGEGFYCLNTGDKILVREDGLGLYLLCTHGRHFLDGQINDKGEYIGLTHANPIA
jgi:hypothetical protein